MPKRGLRAGGRRGGRPRRTASRNRSGGGASPVGVNRRDLDGSARERTRGAQVRVFLVPRSRPRSRRARARGGPVAVPRGTGARGGSASLAGEGSCGAGGGTE